MVSPEKKGSASGGSQAGRVSIINAVQTPLGFFTLGLLILEGGLLAVSSIVPEQNRTSLFWGCLILIFLTILVVAFLAYSRPEYLFGRNLSATFPVVAESKQPKLEEVVPKGLSFKHDIFLSSPMAALPSTKEYEANRKLILELIDTFRRECGFDKIFYAGRDIGSVSDFDPEGISVKDDLKAIEESRYFVMIYHSKVVTSALVEAGCAVALRKPSLYFVRTEDDLPFLLKQAVQAFIDVKIYRSENIKDVMKLVCKQRLKLFGQ
jgi:hypothetical protein